MCSVHPRFLDQSVRGGWCGRYHGSCLYFPFPGIKFSQGLPEGQGQFVNWNPWPPGWQAPCASLRATGAMDGSGLAFSVLNKHESQWATGSMDGSGLAFSILNKHESH